MSSCFRLKCSRTNGICNMAEKYKKINKKCQNSSFARKR